MFTWFPQYFKNVLFEYMMGRQSEVSQQHHPVEHSVFTALIDSVSMSIDGAQTVACD